jgi:hypothetical protein
MTQTIVALFDTTAEAEQAMQYVIMSIGGVEAQVYYSNQVADVSSLSIRNSRTHSPRRRRCSCEGRG